MIECSLQEAKRIHSEGKLGNEVNYIFLHAPTVEDMTVRLLRSKPGQDTQQSLTAKQNRMRADIEEAKKLPFINKTFVSEGSKEDLIKKAAIYIVFQLYKMKQ
jgi:guanylate kinase